MKRTIPLLLLLAIFAIACSGNDTTTAAPRPTPSPSTTSPASATSPAAIDPNSVLAGIDLDDFDGVVAIRAGDEIAVRSGGLADRENHIEIDDDTVFDIGSVSKQFTAAAILRLEMDGLLSVDDALGDHLPNLPASKAAITLHQLLTHTSGLPVGFGPDDQPLTRAGFLSLVHATDLAAEPGEFLYSNAGYSLLALVIEAATGESYEQYLQRALFEPAGMTDTGYIIPDWDGHTIAVGYAEPSGERFGRPTEQPWDVDGPYWNLHGNGGLLSTASDMLRWDQTLTDDTVLDTDARTRLMTPYVPDADYAYGWLSFPTPAGTLVTHNGGNNVFYAEMMRFVDEDVTTYVMTNADQGDAGDLAAWVANTALGGALDSILEDDGHDEDYGGPGASGQDDETPEEGLCGLMPLSPDSLSNGTGPDFPVISALPSTPPGQALRELVDLLTDGDADARLRFAQDHTSPRFGIEDPAAIATELETLQARLDSAEMTTIHQEDPRHFHLLWSGTDADALLSVGFDEGNLDQVACLALWQ